MPYGDYPQSATNAAKRALDHREENGTNCGTRVGWARANQLANREEISEQTIRRTYSFLARAEAYTTPSGNYYDEEGNERCGNIMYDAWGAKSMYNWCARMIEEFDNED